MELETCIKGRRSIRAYTAEPVPREKIEAILEAGVWAATAIGRQPWRFVIIENGNTIKFISDETKKAVSEAIPMFAKRFETSEDVICYNAPVLILICAETDKSFNHSNLIDSALAEQNMSLKAFELGLGTCYMGWIDMLVGSKPEVMRKAGVPEGSMLWCL